MSGSLKTPWTLIDPDGEGILARIVTDGEMGHVAVFESPAVARAVVETMNRAESREQELAEVTAELGAERESHAKAQAELEKARQLHASCREMMCERERELNSSRAKHDIYKAVAKETVAKLRGELGEANSQCICTPAERKVLEAMAVLEHIDLRCLAQQGRVPLALLAEAELARRGEEP